MFGRVSPSSLVWAHLIFFLLFGRKRSRRWCKKKNTYTNRPVFYSLLFQTYLLHTVKCINCSLSIHLNYLSIDRFDSIVRFMFNQTTIENLTTHSSKKKYTILCNVPPKVFLFSFQLYLSVCFKWNENNACLIDQK